IGGTSTGRFNISGGLNVVSGVNNLADALLNISGTSTIGSLLNITNNGGQKDFNNLIITSSGSWNCTVMESFTINGNFSNDGIFTSNVGVYDLAGANKTISGLSNST